MNILRQLPRKMRLVLPIVAIASAGLTGGVVVAGLTAPVPSASDEVFIQVAGVGETMLIVVAGDYSSRADAEAAAALHSFGEMQGFYIDTTDNYTVVGVYDQASVDQRVVACDDANAADPEVCLPGLSAVRVYVPVSLLYIAKAGAAQYLSEREPTGCGSPGNRPCVRSRLSRQLTAVLDLKPNRFLLLSAFRTKRGAEEFVDLARAAGFDSLTTMRVRKIGGGYVGLGQEAHPDGVTGPLLKPLPDLAKYQE